MHDDRDPLPPVDGMPDIPLEALPQLLDAEILLDQVRDAPHMHVAEAVGMAIGARAAGVDMRDVNQVRLIRPR